MQLKNILSSFSSVIMSPIIFEATNYIVDAIPPKLSLMNLIPQTLVRANEYIYDPYLYLEKNCNISKNQSILIAGPLYEELIYRVGIQKILLKEVPQIIFSDNQTLQKFLDSKIAKVARIALTSFMFVSLHYSPIRDTMPGAEELGNVSFVCSLLGGIWTGALMEWTNNPIYPIMAHITHNSFAQFL